MTCPPAGSELWLEALPNRPQETALGRQWAGPITVPRGRGRPGGWGWRGPQDHQDQSISRQPQRRLLPLHTWGVGGPSAGSPHNFLRNENFLAAKKMESMSGLMWCLTLGQEPREEQVGGSSSRAEPAATSGHQEATKGHREMGELLPEVSGQLSQSGGPRRVWGSPGCLSRRFDGYLTFLFVGSFVCIDCVFTWLRSSRLYYKSVRTLPLPSLPRSLPSPTGKTRGASGVSSQSPLMQTPAHRNTHSLSSFLDQKIIGYTHCCAPDFFHLTIYPRDNSTIFHEEVSHSLSTCPPIQPAEHPDLPGWTLGCCLHSALRNNTAMVFTW